MIIRLGRKSLWNKTSSWEKRNFLRKLRSGSLSLHRRKLLLRTLWIPKSCVLWTLKETNIEIEIFYTNEYNLFILLQAFPKWLIVYSSRPFLTVRVLYNCLREIAILLCTVRDPFWTCLHNTPQHPFCSNVWVAYVFLILGFEKFLGLRIIRFYLRVSLF